MLSSAMQTDLAYIYKKRPKLNIIYIFILNKTPPNFNYYQRYYWFFFLTKNTSTRISFSILLIMQKNLDTWPSHPYVFFKHSISELVLLVAPSYTPHFWTGFLPDFHPTTKVLVWCWVRRSGVQLFFKYDVQWG